MKHSENGWPICRLEDIADIASGVTKGRQLEGPTVTVPYLRVANVQAGRLDLSEIKEIEVLAPEVDKYRLKAGDILMTEGGDRDKLGRGTVWRGQIDPCIHQNHVFRVRPQAGRLVSEYLNYYMLTPAAKKYFLHCAKQTTGIASINRTQLSGLPVPLPPPDDQKRIIAILDKAEGLQRRRREALGLTEPLAQAAFVDLFEDMRPDRSCWPVLCMGELLAIPPNYGSMEVPVDRQNDTARWLDLRVANIQDGKLDLTSRKYVAISPDMIRRHEVQEGDLLLARAIGSPEQLGKCIVARPNEEPWAFDSHLMRVRFRRDVVDPDFIHGYLTGHVGRQEFLKHSRRSAVQYNINTKEFSEIRVPVPPRELQAAYLRQLRQIRQIEANHQRGLAAVDDLFNALIQRAFRGEL